MVDYGGRWKHPEEVAVDARSDEALQRTLAEYDARREGMPETAEAHWNLGLWCEQNGLQPEATAHFTSVTRIDPNRADAWARLGCRKFGGRWLSETQVAAEQAEAEIQKQANVRWGSAAQEVVERVAGRQGTSDRGGGAARPGARAASGADHPDAVR